MKVELKDLWEELELDESLKEYVEGRIDNYIFRITDRADNAIKTLVASALEEMRKDIESSKTFAICADTKINKHLLSHCKLPEELVKASEDICNLPEPSAHELRNRARINKINLEIK